ncbi:MAG: hypothetical protein ACOC1F_07450, partial [Myxococcota bacterium]
MRCRSSFLPLLSLSACLATWMLGCNPKIGDDCTNSTDCSVSGDRLCDTTQPGGYCTVFNCEPDMCPEEAQCVAFDTEFIGEETYVPRICLVQVATAERLWLLDPLAGLDDLV